jgi:hypothetical protein
LLYQSRAGFDWGALIDPLGDPKDVGGRKWAQVRRLSFEPRGADGYDTLNGRSMKDYMLKLETELMLDSELTTGRKVGKSVEQLAVI